jgi:hypothetical protein
MGFVAALEEMRNLASQMVTAIKPMSESQSALMQKRQNSK